MGKETILVTGGAGFIGSHLVESLLQEDYRVICLDNFNDSYSPLLKEQNIRRVSENPDFELIRGDILDIQLLHDIFSGNYLPEPRTQTQRPKTDDRRPTKVVHLAAMAGVRASLISPDIYIDVDVKGTLNLLEVARNYDVKQFIFASSSSVYGINKKVPFSPDDPLLLQVSPYAAAKRCAELYCRTYHHLYNIPITILRLFTVYGPRQRPDMAIRKFISLIFDDKPIPVFGDGKSGRDYTYVSDC
ncbi:NAD-dependent epimerase/dehydratase family protein, partial [candidate division WOR-3 bacterium]|nr:NAD-dependent epimerase/dehydratase family protein [candidate division WOR-3 bacterium]